MLKAKQLKVEESNVALIGSDLDKKARRAAADKEPAWKGAGQKPELKAWRIEKFKVIPWDKPGQFHEGDSYIILNTYKEKLENNLEGKLKWDIHFWLGKDTTQDEMGTAAYKTVELDDYLGGEPVQHREVQGYESELFNSYFPTLAYLPGGIDSGFKKVEAEKFEPRLYHCKGKKKITVTLTPVARDSLNSGDVFVLDLGDTIIRFDGKDSGMMERNKAAQFVNQIKVDGKRKGGAVIHIIREDDTDTSESKLFWEKLGGKGPIKNAEEGGNDTEWEKQQGALPKRLFQLTEQKDGTMTFKMVAENNNIKGMSQFDHTDTMIFDSGREIYVWLGEGATEKEKTGWAKFVDDYKKQYNRPNQVPVTSIKDHMEPKYFKAALPNYVGN